MIIDLLCIFEKSESNIYIFFNENFMKVDFTSHDILVNSDHKEYVIGKLKTLTKFGSKMNDDSAIAKVELRKSVNHTEGKHIECEVTVSVPRGVLRAEVHANQVNEAIDKAVDKLKKQVAKYAEKAKSKKKAAMNDIPVPIEDEFVA